MFAITYKKNNKVLLASEVLYKDLGECAEHAENLEFILSQKGFEFHDAFKAELYVTDIDVETIDEKWG